MDENKTAHAPHGYQTMLLELLGGFTQQVRGLTSWEAGTGAPKHVWAKGSGGIE